MQNEKKFDDVENKKDVKLDKVSGENEGKYPKAVWFIVGNEFCERFSFYGMRAVLTLYFTQVLLLSENASTQAYHIFATACYFTPLFGAIIADSYLGKFKTILYISIIYVTGNILLSYSSFIEKFVPSLIGLVLIAIGTGGIKPCVSAFGGDQFGIGQERLLSGFFAVFYFSINAGSLISTALTPIFRQDISCSSRGDCFPLAFGVPAALMAIALFLFILGRPMYKIIPPAKGNIVLDVCAVVNRAISKKIYSIFSNGAMAIKEHWLDHADDKYDPKLIADVKTLMRILFLYIPLPVFWALFDQQGSRWTLQALRMNGNFFNLYRVKPDQIQVINPLLILVMIPLFEYLLYPLLKRCHLLKKPLQRMTVGGVLGTVSFLFAAFLQMAIDAEVPSLPQSGFAQLNLINAGSCSLTVSGKLLNENLTINAFNVSTWEVKANEEFTLSFAYNCVGQPASAIKTQRFTLADKQQQIIAINPRRIDNYKFDYNNLILKSFNHNFERPERGANARFYFDFLGGDNLNDTLLVTNGKHEHKLSVQNGLLTNHIDLELENERSTYDLKLANRSHRIDSLELEYGGSYVVILTAQSDRKIQIDSRASLLSKVNQVSIFWQSLQYIVITAAEIMFSITGLEFSYSQAPPSMKSVLQAAWLLTVAVGNLLVVIITKSIHFEKQTSEFIFFAAFMLFDILVFAVMAYFYKPTKALDEPECGKHDSSVHREVEAEISQL